MRLSADIYAAEQRAQISEGCPEPTDMAFDAQAEINQIASAEDEPAAPPPIAKESSDKAAADAALSAMTGADRSPSKAALIHLA